MSAFNKYSFRGKYDFFTVFSKAIESKVLLLKVP